MQWLTDARHDLRYAARSLLRAPAFSIAAVLTLAIGIGAASAIYSIVDAILLRPLPYPNSDRLVRVIEHIPHVVPGRQGFQAGIAYPAFVEWRTRTKTLTNVAAVIGMGPRLVPTRGGLARLWGGMASADVFAMFNARPLLGRTLEPTDDGRDVVVLSHDTWLRHFAGDSNILGTAIEMRPQAGLPVLRTVVGVLPEGFNFPTGVLDFFIPTSLDAKARPQVTMVAHLRDGVMLEDAAAEANAIGSALYPPRPASAPRLTGPRFDVLGVKDDLIATLRPALRILLGAVGVVLLIVCANVANLLLARGTTRHREIAVRRALGATRGRIVRHLLAECTLLAAVGGVLGGLIGAGGVALVKQLATLESPGLLRLVFGTTILPRANEVTVNGGLFAVAFALAAVTCIAFGALPALHVSRTSQLQAMGTRSGGSRRGDARMRAALVVGQLAMATVLLVAAGLLAHSFVKLASTDRGYDPSRVLAFQLLLPNEYAVARKVETIDTLLARFRASPNVEAAGFARHGILISEELYIGTVVPPGRTLDEMRQDVTTRTRVRSISAGFLAANAVPILAGREFADSDTASASPVIVVNRQFAERYFGSANPVGQAITWHVGKNSTAMTIVGVAEGIRNESLTSAHHAEVFLDYRQFLSFYEKWGEPVAGQNEGGLGFFSFAVRTRTDPLAHIPAVRQIVQDVDSAIGIDSILPLERMMANSMARPRFYAVIVGVFAIVAAALAAIGIYGVLAYAVVQRTQEIGVRMALGAERAQVLLLVLRRGLVMTIAGIGVGLLGAAAATSYLQSMLFGVEPVDGWTFALVALMFSLVTLTASLVPARRATRVEPVVALRCD